MLWAWRQLDDLRIDEGDRSRMQPCFSPVWDTAIATIALSDCRQTDDESAVARAVAWLLAKEVRSPGDWQTRRPGIEPSGWHFQYRNEFYPDIDDTAMVLMALLRSPESDDGPVQEAVGRGTEWLLSMQNRDGGWAAFDVDIDNQVLTKVPFADHNAMLDPSCADITARIIELLGTLGYDVDHPAIARGPGVPLEDPGAARLLVRTLGRELHLRNLAGPARAQGDRLSHESPRPGQGGRLAGVGPAAVRRLGRDLPQL